MFHALQRTLFLTIAIVFIATGVTLGGQAEKVRRFDLAESATAGRTAESLPPGFGLQPPASPRAQVGSALSAEEGIGFGLSVAVTYDDAQNLIGWGRHISHWWNGQVGSTAEVSVHFGYRVDPNEERYGPGRRSGYNVYDATGDAGLEWPLLRDIGCTLQVSDTAGYGLIPSLAVMDNGRVVMASGWSHFHNGFLGDGSPYQDNMEFYQDGEFECDYTYGVDVTMVDSLMYRPYFMDQSDGNYSRDPIIETQWDGVNTVVHLLMTEEETTELQGDDYVDNQEYYTAVYFRKVGTGAQDGTWSSGQVIDSVWFPWLSMAAAPYPYEGVAITYTNPSYYGALLNNDDDIDVWCRESSDRGLSWGDAYDITNYTNPIAGDPNHFTAWLESQCLFTSDGDLHVIWTAKPTTTDPYFDGFNWNDWFENIYHWSKSAGVISEVVSGTYEDAQYGAWECNFNTATCGLGGSNAGTIANINISECDGKLYCVWNQIHERASDGWCIGWGEPIPGTVDDCAYYDSRLASANWEILMSATYLSNPSNWDLPRNLSNTYTPGCGLPDDPEASGPCGNEYKPMVERYGFDETGLDVSWPSETICDPTPAELPPYSGSSYLNMQYVDDQFPGPSDWSNRTTDARTVNSIKWVRLACVEPIFAPVIDVSVSDLTWPTWAQTGQITPFPVTVVNTGNASLNISDVVCDDGGAGWLSTNFGWGPVIQPPTGTVNFDILIDGTAMTEPTWLQGTVTIVSDAVNVPSWEIPINLLATDHVEPVYWDTVATHPNMFSDFFDPSGECVALSVSNNGEMGQTATGHGSVNLDYVESELECGERTADAIYLKGGSAFVITADDVYGNNAQVTSSYGLADQASVYSWDPTNDLGSMQWGEHLGPLGAYDSAYTGRIVNRDTTIAIERTYYAPRSQNPDDETINFVIAVTKVYSADGDPHNHVTLGDVYNWDVPSDSVARNNSYVDASFPEMVYFTGTDTTNPTSCQSNESRYATAVFGGGWDGSQEIPDVCEVNSPYDYYGCVVLPEHIVEDTAYYRDGTPLVPRQPNPLVWWQETAVPGLNPASSEDQNSDQAVWMTYRYDYSLGAEDTLYYWVILTTVRDGSLEQLQEQVIYAANWFGEHLFGCDPGGGGCCEGHVGDANSSGDDSPTIGDISVIIDAKFISEDCSMILCLSEADLNQSGGCDPTCDDITIGDITFLIDRLFIRTECLEPGMFFCMPLCLPCNTPGWWK